MSDAPTEARKILALTSTQGTAMAETAICDNHWSKSYTEIRRGAEFIKDWDKLDFVDCSGNPELQCILCGATGGEA